MLCNLENKHTAARQCCCYSRNVAEVTLKNSYFYFQKLKKKQDPSIKKLINLIAKITSLLLASAGNFKHVVPSFPEQPDAHSKFRGLDAHDS